MVGWDPDTDEFWDKVAQLGQESYRAAKRKASVDKALRYMLSGTTLRLINEIPYVRDENYSPTASDQE